METPKKEPGSGGTSGSAHGHDGIEHFDPDPCGHALILEELVAALHEAGLKGDPRCSGK